MRRAILVATYVFLPLSGAATAAEEPRKVHVIVFDFSCKPAKLGQQLADSVRVRLRRHKEYEVLDRLTTAEVSKPLPETTDPKKVGALLKDKLGMHMAIYGSVSKSGANVTVRAAMVSLANPKKTTHWTKSFSDDTERARGELARKIVEAVRGSAEWKPPEYGDEAEPKTWPAKPINTNGSFEMGDRGWEPADNAVTFIEPGPAGRGKVLRIRTNVERDKWLEYKRKLMFGLTTPKNPPTLKPDTSYGSLAGLEGVHYKSDWIKADAGQRYWLIADMKGKTAGIFFPKIFVKGFCSWGHRADGLSEHSLIELKMSAKDFAALPRDRQKQMIAADVEKHPKRYLRECFRWYLACRNEENVWKHYAAVCPPRGGLPDNVEWLQIQVYTYWPPGEFLFDDVHLYKDPRQTAPQKVEGARTPQFGKTSDVVERLDEFKAAILRKTEQLKKARDARDKPKAATLIQELNELRKQLDAFQEHYKRHQRKDSRY